MIGELLRAAPQYCSRARQADLIKTTRKNRDGHALDAKSTGIFKNDSSERAKREATCAISLADSNDEHALDLLIERLDEKRVTSDALKIVLFESALDDATKRSIKIGQPSAGMHMFVQVDDQEISFYLIKGHWLSDENGVNPEGNR